MALACQLMQIVLRLAGNACSVKDRQTDRQTVLSGRRGLRKLVEARSSNLPRGDITGADNFNFARKLPQMENSNPLFCILGEYFPTR